MTARGAVRVAVNLLWCLPGRVGGSEEYLARQLAGLGAVDPGRARVRPTLFVPADYPAAHPELADLPAVAARGRLDRRGRRVLLEHTWLRRRARIDPVRVGAFDVIHHGGGTTPLLGDRPTVLTIHDLQWRELPDLVAPAKLRYLRAVVPRSVGRAAVVAVPTEFVRGTVLEAFDIDPERVVVVPHGVDRPDAPVVDEAALRERWGLGTGPLLVYPAITHPHKNHRLLLETLRDHWTDPDLRLVLLGGRGAAEADVERAISGLGVGGRVVRPGRVPDGDRDGLLAIADALVFPSTYEGFGAPLIEAMALGTPVICGDHPAMREVVGEAGLVTPLVAEAWGEALDVARRRRRELSVAGRERVERFSIAASGTALASAYERAARS